MNRADFGLIFPILETSSIYCCLVNRKYLQVVLLEAAIIAGLVVLGRFFS